MSRILGRGRYIYGTYPSPSNSSASALQNRNVAIPTVMTAPFTPAVPPGSILAAILYTPRVSGVVQVTAMLDLINGATPEAYALVAEIVTGTGLTVTGGETGTPTFSPSNGWVIGSSPNPPVVGGVVTDTNILGAATITLAANENGSLTVSAISQPLPVGVPVVIKFVLEDTGGVADLTTLEFTSLSILELP